VLEILKVGIYSFEGFLCSMLSLVAGFYITPPMKVVVAHNHNILCFFP